MAGMDRNGGNQTPHGSDQSPNHLPSLISSINCFPITLKFVDVCYKVKIDNKSKYRGCLFGHKDKPGLEEQERTILHGITGMVSPGEILAILGPSGSGKSTLLNALAGRLTYKHQGTVLANDRAFTKAVLRRTGFVPQDDVLYPHLTVRETLVFCSLLRLPRTLSKKDKISAAESIISELGLHKCENTIIGNTFVRGVSGGERKRVSIAHEMLMNPSLLILDEPTSGLDSTAAHRLLSTLGSLAHKGKTIVTSMHQPSSRVYQMLDSVLVLCDGKCLYFGKGCEAISYFGSIGFAPAFPMNPADFVLDLANVCQLNGLSERDKPKVKEILISSYNTLLSPKVKVECLETTSATTKEMTYVQSHCSKERRTSIGDVVSTWFNQFSILLQRSLKERRHESFNSLRIFQVVAAALLADIQDHLGLLFFISIFWGVLPSFNSVFAFPQERAIFIKEQASGMYTLSSYFMARMVGDLPMELILPTIFLIMVYWMAGLKPDLGAFLITLLVLLGYVLVSQGLGLALGAAIMDAKRASTIATVTMLAFLLTGGYYVHKVPSCLAWVKYISTTFYSYRLLINVQYGEGSKISSLLGCSSHHHDHAGDHKASCNFVEQDVEGQISPATSICVMLFMFFAYRLLAYLALRRSKV
ncbi:ABC transporter G family member 25-like [Pyrus ussuriensis x Pyrus communis]|uniref:ABC transporter G family member 25-like n=1 Tax=Pyrus ussuriensis x Pyrus communis TaxID=2448454 RepID=A0A5N5FJQ8_9ROSA|nr:ABC transporter G family member 25-like [Pyrus ussuriensis x Pyrus communis]